MLQPFVAQTGRGSEPCWAGTNRENVFRLQGFSFTFN
jgi:hypothetical protein